MGSFADSVAKSICSSQSSQWRSENAFSEATCILRVASKDNTETTHTSIMLFSYSVHCYAHTWNSLPRLFPEERWLFLFSSMKLAILVGNVCILPSLPDTILD